MPCHTCFTAIMIFVLIVYNMPHWTYLPDQGWNAHYAVPCHARLCARLCEDILTKVHEAKWFGVTITSLCSSVSG